MRVEVWCGEVVRKTGRNAGPRVHKGLFGRCAGGVQEVCRTRVEAQAWRRAKDARAATDAGRKRAATAASYAVREHAPLGFFFHFL